MAPSRPETNTTMGWEGTVSAPALLLPRHPGLPAPPGLKSSPGHSGITGQEEPQPHAKHCMHPDSCFSFQLREGGWRWLVPEPALLRTALTSPDLLPFLGEFMEIVHG